MFTDSDKEEVEEVKEPTKEDKLCSKIHKCNHLWDWYEAIVMKARKEEVTFLQNNFNDIRKLHTEEVNKLRVELCKERGE